MLKKLKEFLDNPWLWIFIVVIGLSFYLGKLWRLRHSQNPRINYELAENRKWSKLLLVLDQIEKNYVDTVSNGDIMEKSLPHILESLDPHSVYLPPKDLQAADESLSGNFSGVGIEFNVPEDTLVVINVVPNGPSERIGIRSGDRIVTIDGRNVAGVKFSQDSMMKMLRGPINTKVNVGVKRSGEKDLLDFSITRAIIPVHSIDVAVMLTPTLGYIKISTFALTTYKEFMVAAARLSAEGMTSLVLDLRDNPGGYLEQAYALANEFLNKGDMVVYMEGRMRKREDFIATGSGHFKDLKLYVAINENSASSSEIVAGAIQDNHRGTIIGRRSFGKGLVQEPVYFSDSSGIRLTVARFYTPSGRCIQKPYTEDYRYDILERYQRGEMQNADSIKVGGGGIVPDVFVPMDTVGVTDYLVKVNRKSLLMKFSSQFADRNRAALSGIDNYTDLEALFTREALASQFRLYAISEGVRPNAGEWEESGDIIMEQLKGLIGRYSALKEEAFYHYILKIDNLVEKVKELDSENQKTS
ncbi:MAG: S41 family peptidase [Bacteroidales bacterium]|nr:S41 family peptidase [Bacteroidales bacterium]